MKIPTREEEDLKLLKMSLKTIKALETVNIAFRVGGRSSESSLDYLLKNKARVILELEQNISSRKATP